MSSIADVLIEGRNVDKSRLRAYLAAREIVSAKDPAFGAVGDGNTDDTVAIQAAVDWAIYQHDVKQHSLGMVYLPAGRYKTSDTLHLGYGTSFSSVVLEGAGLKYAGETGFCGTAIVPTFNDRPAIAIQGGRASGVKNLTIVGKNLSHITGNRLGSVSGPLNGINDLLDASWVDPRFPATSSSRYAPYAAIAIDPYSGVAPATKYPNVNYPAFLGAVAQYGKAYSSKTTIENVQITGFVVGVANQPCDGDGNGDYTKLNKCQIMHCQYGVSIGNTQSRLVHISDSELITVHTGIVTTKHGRQNGKPQILVESTEIGSCINVINAPNVSYGGGPKFHGCYGEVIYSLGLVGGGGAGACPTTFDQCEFNFHSRSTRGEPAYTFNNTGEGYVAFKSCVFDPGTSRALRLHFGGSSEKYTFENCSQTTNAFATNLYEKFALNATSGVTFDYLGTETAAFNMKVSTNWNLTSGAKSGSRRRNWRDYGGRNDLLGVYSRFVRSQSAGDPGVPVQISSGGLIDKSAIVGAITTSGRSVTFVTGKTAAWLITYGGEVGDCVWDQETGTLFYVRWRTGSTITMEAQTNYNSAGNINATLTKTGYFYVLNCRTYTTSEFLQGDTTAGTNVITHIGAADGHARFITADIAVNDYIAVFDQIDNSLGTAAGANLITDVNADAFTITTAGKQAYSATKKRIPLFWRAAPANV
jgi:Pectate lyase superfamily protein